MPYRWADTPEPQQLKLTPHQSMTPEGFVVFMAATFALVLVPLLAVLGSPVLWALLPFFALTIWGLWFAIERNKRDAALTETLTLWPDRIELVRVEPRGATKRWDANPHWVSVHLHRGDKPVEKYLTLRGGGREVELGAFLSPEEREALHGDLLCRLSRR
jgi:uncharacterized membrane protein